ncbi:hypothetical protein [Treponema sp.]|uniref:hypothetical protein n=1 Tax=Treponema sp. TaxID=166 RepID=UPI00298E3810|nr:hypothetical protein [Treponema sp.]MCQ2240699.1 hypothetical protein [Treponema sp.]
MEIEYVGNGNKEPEENFILPQTEKAINQIIDEFSYFFAVCRFVLQVVYIVYLILRFIYLERFQVYTMSLLGVCFIQFIFLLVSLKRQKKLSRKIVRPVRFAKRLVSLAVAVIMALDIFGAQEVIQRWQAITGVLICLGWILSLAGDVFAATVPRYARMILTSFKKDIDPQALASRSISKVKEAAGNMAKRKAVRSWRNLKSWFNDLIDP